MISARHPYRVFLLVSVAIVGASTYLVLAGDGSQGYWSRHPMLGSLVSGLLLAAFIGAVVERWLERREEQRWHSVARLACHTLGDSVTRPIIHALAGLVVGPSAVKPSVWMARTRSYPADQHPILHASRLPVAWPERGAVWSEAVELKEGELVPVARLLSLLSDRDWLQVAIGYLRPLRHETRAVLAPWAAVMISADEPRRLLNHAAALNDELGYLRVQLEELQAALETDQPTVSRLMARLVVAWQVLDARARMLTNAFWVAADSGEYSYWLPNELTGTSVDDAFKGVSVKDAGASPARVGRWRPMHPGF